MPQGNKVNGLSPREQVAALLGNLPTVGSFSARCTARPDDLVLEVRGVGQLLFPVPDEQARQLRAVAGPARYGKGEDTLLDRRVRDTGQVPLSRVKIDKRRWNRTLAPVLEKLGSELGLPSGSRLRAELHSMLAYTRGHFFVPHQDSEKADNMVATLVVTLPGTFTGGSLVVTHGGKTVEHRGSKNALSFFAFYADCRHEVRPVRSGNRIVLTYNLLLDGASATAEPAPATVDPMAALLADHFRTPCRPRWVGEAVDAPDRLVYLLDHEYTPRGLSWDRLKGADAVRVAALRAAADRAGCESMLALADVHETWDCEDDGWGRRRWDDDEGDDHELGELLDWDVTLTHLGKAAGAPAEPIANQVLDAEVGATTPSVQLQPYDSQYEGYMGNYGNTMDRWYHRGAVVVWPWERAFAVHAQASPRWGLATLAETIDAGDVARARELATTLNPFWGKAVGERQRALITRALEVAAALDEPDLAAMLLRPFRVECLTGAQAARLVAVVARYGGAWADALLTAQAGKTRLSFAAEWPSDAREAWVAALPHLCEALQAADPVTGTVAAGLLLRLARRWLDEQLTSALAIDGPSRRDEGLAGLAMPLLGVLAGAQVVRADDVQDEMTAAIHHRGAALLSCLMLVLRHAAKTVPATARPGTGLDAVTEQCASWIRARLARPVRAADDWSLTPPGRCGCELCNTLGEFLADPARLRFDWPLAEAKRKHVHGEISRAELPVDHRTQRSGSPYTLVLTKSTEIFEREVRARHRDEADFAWLETLR